MTYEAVALFSGGKDSTAALWWGLQKHHSVLALSINYNGRPERERRIAREICSDYSIPQVEADLAFLRPLGLVLGTQVNTRPQGYIPMRNLIFYAVAGYFADINNCNTIIGGHVKSDGEAHSDASPQFFQALSATFSVALSKSFARAAFAGSTPSGLVVELPLHDLADDDALRLGYRLGAPIERSWSCWEDRDEPCGECVSCRDRERAMNLLKQDTV